MSDDSGIRVELVEGLNQTPALPLAIRGWLELEEQYLGYGTFGIGTDSNAFIGYAMNGREQLPVGVMAWSFYKNDKRVWIAMSYVLPEFRGRGVYSAMWARMVEHAATELKAATIESGTHVKNTAMRAVARKQGRFEESVTTRFDLI